MQEVDNKRVITNANSNSSLATSESQENRPDEDDKGDLQPKSKNVRITTLPYS